LRYYIFLCALYRFAVEFFQKFLQEFKFRFSFQYTDHFTFRQCTQSIPPHRKTLPQKSFLNWSWTMPWKPGTLPKLCSRIRSKGFTFRQRFAARLATNDFRFSTHYTPLLDNLNWIPLSQLAMEKRAVLANGRRQIPENASVLKSPGPPSKRKNWSWIRALPASHITRSSP
jgi:hypothetical protein